MEREVLVPLHDWLTQYEKMLVCIALLPLHPALLVPAAAALVTGLQLAILTAPKCRT